AAPRLVAVGPECAALLPPAASGRGPARYAFGPAAPPLASFDALYLDGDAPALPEAPGGAGLVILYTAAVGGRPRGALLSQRSLLARAMQAAQAFGLSADDVNLGVLPLCHVTAIGLLLAAQWAGGATLLMPRFEPEALVRAIEAERGSLLGV